MDWLSRHAQSSLNKNEDGGIVSYVNKEEDDNKNDVVIFDGNIVNDVIINNILKKIDSIPKEAIDYMSKSNKTTLDKFIISLSDDNKLSAFIDVVKSYIKDGIADAVLTGKKEGLLALQKWYSDMSVFTNNRDIFGLSNKISTDQFGV